MRTKEVMKHPSASRLSELRQISGAVRINSLLVSFLYELMRDHVPPGTVEQILMNTTDPDVTYTNGYLARYAENVAKELLKKGKR